MRILNFATVTAVLVATLILMPLASPPSAVAEPTVSTAGPVKPIVTEVPIDRVAAAAAAAGAAATAAPAAAPQVAHPVSTPVVIQQISEKPFSAVGFKYDAGFASPTIDIKVREHGTWSDWQHLDTTDGGPDANTAEGLRAAARVTTEPLLSSAADAFEVRVTAVGGPLPTGFVAVTIDPGSSAADANLQGTVPMAPSLAGSDAAPTATTAAAGDLVSPAPTIITRAQWGADESLRQLQPGCEPRYNSTIKVGFVHHVASTNNYDAAGAAAEVRAIYAYHVLTNGWCDFGYNFVVDKFGRVYEGRYGGVTLPVVGAHTGGFNKDSFGVSALGNYDIAQPSDIMVSAIARVLGWKLGLHNRNPLGKDNLVSAGGGTDKWPVGQTVTFNVVSGHRDSGNTVCPGQYLYPRLGSIRVVANAISQQTNTTITDAAPANQQVDYAGSPARFGAYVPSAQPWDLTIVEETTGKLVQHSIGYTEPGTFPGVWDLRDASGNWARGGMYVWYLRTAAGGFAAAKIEVLPPRETARAAPFSGGVSNAGFTPIAPIRVYDSRPGTTQPLGPGSSRTIRVVGGSTGLPSSGVAAVALNVTAVDATQPSYVTAWPAGGLRPGTSSLNVTVGDTVPGMVVVPVGSNGSVAIANDAGSVHLLVDVIGYFPTSGGSRMHTVAPVRVVDGASSPMANAESRTIDLATTLGVDRSTLTGAVVNVTIAGASAPGNVLVHPAGAPSDSSTANVVMGRDVSNRSLVATADGRISVRNVGGTARVFVDVVGYFTTDGTGSRYTSIAANRLLDTRFGPGQRAPLGTAETMSIKITGVGRVPANAMAVLGTLTSDRASAPSYLRVWATGGAPPATSDLNPTPMVATANATVLPPGQGGSAQIYNNAGTTHVILDVVGYFS